MTSPGDWCVGHNDTLVGPHESGRLRIRNRRSTGPPAAQNTCSDSVVRAGSTRRAAAAPCATSRARNCRNCGQSHRTAGGEIWSFLTARLSLARLRPRSEYRRRDQNRIDERSDRPACGGGPGGQRMRILQLVVVNFFKFIREPFADTQSQSDPDLESRCMHSRHDC